jgi:hypothetical protein
MQIAIRAEGGMDLTDSRKWGQRVVGDSYRSRENPGHLWARGQKLGSVYGYQGYRLDSMKEVVD